MVRRVKASKCLSRATSLQQFFNCVEFQNLETCAICGLPGIEASEAEPMRGLMYLIDLVSSAPDVAVHSWHSLRDVRAYLNAVDKREKLYFNFYEVPKYMLRDYPRWVKKVEALKEHSSKY